MSENKYKVTLYAPNLVSSFTTDCKKSIIKAWLKKEKIRFTQPDGKEVFYDFSKYNCMEIIKNE